jgi:hypothetical protein
MTTDDIAASAPRTILREMASPKATEKASQGFGRIIRIWVERHRDRQESLNLLDKDHPDRAGYAHDHARAGGLGEQAFLATLGACELLQRQNNRGNRSARRNRVTVFMEDLMPIRIISF